MRDDPREDLLNYLRAHHVMTLATQGSDGPWAAAVFYVNDGSDIFFLSAPSTRHAQNLAADPRVAATVQEDYSDWKQIRGIQMEGQAVRLNVPDSARPAALLARKFSFTAPRLAEGAIAVAMTRIAWFRLRPTAIYFIDNSREFGWRERFDSVALQKPIDP